MLAYLILLPLVLLGAVLAVRGWRRARPRPAGDGIRHCHCPHCHQKLRYRAQPGGRALCPRCMRAFRIPAAETGVPVTGWDPDGAPVDRSLPAA
jgi:hypothetical protein